MQFQETSTPVALPSPNFTVVGTGERFVANPNGTLIAVTENVAHALNNTKGSDSQDTSNTQNSPNITPEQISAISNEIKENLPFGLALVPVLIALGFRDVSAHEESGKLTLGVNEYEVLTTRAQKGSNEGQEISIIRMPNHILEGENTDMASKVINAIKQLFPEQNIQFTLNGLNTMADQHGIFPGYRFASGAESGDVDVTVYAWIEGAGDATHAQYAWRVRNGGSVSSRDDRRCGLCLVASVG